MTPLAATALSLVLLAPPALAADGLIALPCAQSSKATLDRLESLAKARGLKLFARIDHAAGAASIGETLRPTELMIFGHPKGGTPLLKCSQAYGIDLPLHVLAWEDAGGHCWIGYRDPAGLGHTHPDTPCDVALKRLTVTLDEMVREAAKQP
jgi:uncharacterized protein (DUF302 family)